MNSPLARTWAMWSLLAAGHICLVAIYTGVDWRAATAYLLLTAGLALEFLEWLRERKDENHDTK